MKLFIHIVHNINLHQHAALRKTAKYISNILFRPCPHFILHIFFLKINCTLAFGDLYEKLSHALKGSRFTIYIEMKYPCQIENGIGWGSNICHPLICNRIIPNPLLLFWQYECSRVENMCFKKIVIQKIGLETGSSCCSRRTRGFRNQQRFSDGKMFEWLKNTRWILFELTFFICPILKNMFTQNSHRKSRCTSISSHCWAILFWCMYW